MRNSEHDKETEECVMLFWCFSLISTVASARCWRKARDQWSPGLSRGANEKEYSLNLEQYQPSYLIYQGGF